MHGRRRGLTALGLTIAIASCGENADTPGQSTGDGSTSMTAPTSSVTTTITTTPADDSTGTDADGPSSGDTTTQPVIDTTSTTSDTDPSATDSTDVTTDDDSSTDTGEPTMVSCPPMPPDTTLTGTVWAPNGEIPVSGALVYTSQNIPAGIPQEVYCAQCTALACDDISTFTQPDGTFALPVNASEANYLVIQKGQFMRVTALNVQPGNVALADWMTTLPDHNDPNNNLYIPKIALGMASFDRAEDALGKFGLGDTMIANFEETLVPGTESFDLWDNGSSPANYGLASQGSFAQLVQNPANLAQYHIIFVPCSGSTHIGVLNAQAIQNIRDWVEAGGRWYVADWSNEWMEHVFPEYQTLTGEPNNADVGAYDSLADIMDDDMLAWLNALPAGLKDINPLNNESHPTLFQLPQLQTVDNWSVILDTPPVLVPDGMGGFVDVGHKVWLQGPGGSGATGPHPLTVTGQHGCGKIQFTSYHFAEFFDYVGLSPQELVLIYTILEIGVCQDFLPS